MPSHKFVQPHNHGVADLYFLDYLRRLKGAVSISELRRHQGTDRTFEQSQSVSGLRAARLQDGCTGRALREAAKSGVHMPWSIIHCNLNHPIPV